MILLLSFSFLSCNSESRYNSDYGGFKEKTASTSMNEMTSNYDLEEAEESNYYDDQNQNNKSNQVKTERKVIRTATVRMQVENVEKSTSSIEQLIKQQGGFISTTNLSSRGSYINNSITIRIPNEQLDTLLESITAQAKHIDQRIINAQDVTEEFVDIQIRLKTKKDVRDRYVEVLRKKASTVEEILNAEERIRIIQEEIESKEGRLRFLKDQISLSTIQLNMYQNDGKGLVTKSYASKLGQAFGNGWENIKGFIIAMVNIWPFLIMIGILFYLGRKLKIFSRKKSQ